MGPPAAAPPRPRLQVSVIEARNVQADMASSPDFYVTLKMNEQEFQTDTVRGSTSPKFLKDVRLEVEDPENDILRMEMLQVGSKGDCVVGSEKVSIKPLVQSGTLVQWFNLSDAGGTVGAELCLVLRYSTGDKTPQKTGKSKSRSPEPRRQSPAPAAVSFMHPLLLLLSFES
mmetsp:Transcript_35478/g.100445  ORF Transcript_35478/g.100445 Transcript_35478/m.100445 type:complete len:172 (-) Transcript_35478:1073-1588(-)